MIRSTADAEVRALIDVLGQGPPARREAAVARLSILGSRAVGRLVSTWESTTTGRAQQLDVLRVLQASADERVLPVARRALQAGGDVGVAAVALLRTLLERGGGETHARALDMLLAASNDLGQERRIRAAAIEALTNAPDIRAALGDQFDGVGSERDATWEEAVEGRLPEDPAALLDAIDGRAARAPLPSVLRVIEAVRAREASAGDRHAEWHSVRGTLHHLAAARGSRVALYDLRETIEATRAPLPVSYLSAVQMIGDVSCLEALAAAFRRAGSGESQRQLAATFHELAQRLRLTKRHAAMRRALAMAPALTRK